MSADYRERLRRARSLARLLKRAGTSAEDAEARVRAAGAFTDADWRSIRRSVWGES